ncbi:hypothetical protein TNCT_97971 [Trichonephila clavata]|uniref:Uncharacterized protein n=1 Tax=Trichonephila clavata TaxID=2740835 RepID=A0A8X6FAD9_TRICU|nr:hypothetical protein TNCT_97971 [Trichonephila clavata]
MLWFASSRSRSHTCYFSLRRTFLISRCSLLTSLLSSGSKVFSQRFLRRFFSFYLVPDVEQDGGGLMFNKFESAALFQGVLDMVCEIGNCSVYSFWVFNPGVAWDGETEDVLELIPIYQG